jgi:hypothetical protein
LYQNSGNDVGLTFIHYARREGCNKTEIMAMLTCGGEKWTHDDVYYLTDRKAIEAAFFVRTFFNLDDSSLEYAESIYQKFKNEKSKPNRQSTSAGVDLGTPARDGTQ